MKPGSLLILALLALSPALLAGCLSPRSPTRPSANVSITPLPSNASIEAMSVQHPTIPTTDGFQLASHYDPAPNATVGVVLLHQLASSKDSWKLLVSLLKQAGYSTLAIDQRGHGETTKGLKTLAWSRLSTDEQANLSNDAQAAADYLKNQGMAKIIVVGASIGANAALQLGARDASVKAVVALSPGRDYRGVTTSGAVAQAGIPMLLVASEEDGYSFESVKTLAALGPKAETVYLQDKGHGTVMLAYDSTLGPKILDWLKGKVR